MQTEQAGGKECVRVLVVCVGGHRLLLYSLENESVCVCVCVCVWELLGG